MGDLAGRRALVCGASRGIGRAAALALAARGASVALLSRGGGALADSAHRVRVREAGAPEVETVQADLDDRDGAERAVRDLVARWGPIHVWINNTGGPPGGPLLAAEEPSFQAAFGRHVLAPQRLVRVLAPGMAAAGYGRIVNVLSTSVKEPIDGLGVSNLCRAAVAAWAKTLSRELPPGVTINNVLPGFTDTERLAELASAGASRAGTTVDAVRAGWAAAAPEGRVGSPDEIGAVIAFLCSPAAAFVRGVSIPVDGGRLRSL
jgi:3-oxoacyl-[acyl-carrier protein] reductase